MASLLFMLPFMVLVGLAFTGAFLWAIRTGQYEDLEGEKHRIFFEPDPLPSDPRRTEATWPDRRA